MISRPLTMATAPPPPLPPNAQAKEKGEVLFGSKEGQSDVRAAITIQILIAHEARSGACMLADYARLRAAHVAETRGIVGASKHVSLGNDRPLGFQDYTWAE